VATARKLALASRGFEVQNIFIDNLYDQAQDAEVPPNEWGEFVRLQLPSPREDADEGDAQEEGATMDVTVVAEDGAITKVKRAVKKAMKTNLLGWRAKVKPTKMTYREAHDHFGMDKPEGAAEGGGGDDEVAPSLISATSAADAHLGLLSVVDGYAAAGRAPALNPVLQARLNASKGR